MSLMVKICGLRNADNVKAAVKSGADAVGFVFAESIRRVKPAAAARATQYLPKRVKRVAVMRHPTPEEWQEVLEVFSNVAQGRLQARSARRKGPGSHIVPGPCWLPLR